MPRFLVRGEREIATGRGIIVVQRVRAIVHAESVAEAGSRFRNEVPFPPIDFAYSGVTLPRVVRVRRIDGERS